MKTIELSRVAQGDLDAAAQIALSANVNLKDCYQCGKCTGGCPMAHAMDLVPRQVIRCLQLGLADEALQAKSPWICAQCTVCSARCPQGVDIAEVMRAVRLASRAAGLKPVRECDVFEECFIDNVASHGVSNEQYLAASYNLKSGHFMQDVMSAPKMMRLGMIGVMPHNTKTRKDVKALIERTRNGFDGTSIGGGAK